MAGDGGAGVRPGGARGHRLELPPVGIDAGRVELPDQGRGRPGIDRTDPGRNDLEQEFEPVAPRSGEEPLHHAFLTRARLRIVIRVAEDEKLHHVLARPFAELTAIRAKLRLELDRARARKLCRPADPQPGPRGAVQRVPADPVVAENAVARLPVLDLKRRVEAEFLEPPALLGRIALHLLQLHPVVEGEGAQRRPVAPVAHRVAVRGPVDLFQLRVVPEILAHDPAPEEELKLLPARIGRRAAVAADRESAAGIGVFERHRPVLAIEPALEEARHEAVARAEDIEHLDREAGAGLAVIEARRDGAFEGDGPHRPALADQRGARHAAHRAQGRQGIGGAARDVELFLGADDQVEVVQGFLQLCRHLVRGDEPALALAVARDAPEVRPVVDVERCLQPPLARDPQRLQNRRLGARVAEMRPCGDDRARPADEVRVDVVFAQGHVGAVLAVEDQRKLLPVADAEDHERGQPLGVGPDAVRAHAVTPQLFQDEPPHMLVADTADQPGSQPQPRRPAGHVGRRAADILLERSHILQPAADLRSVKVDAGPADGDDIQGPGHRLPLRIRWRAESCGRRRDPPAPRLNCAGRVPARS